MIYELYCQLGRDVENSVCASDNISIDESTVKKIYFDSFINGVYIHLENLSRKNKSFKRNIDSDVESELENILDTKDVSVLRRVFESLIKKQNQQEQDEERVDREFPPNIIGSRQGRQAFVQGRQTFSEQNDDGRCQTTFQTNIQPECETIVETVCSNITVTRTRPDIKETCKTRVSNFLSFIRLVLHGQFTRLIKSVGQPNLRFRRRNALPDTTKG